MYAAFWVVVGLTAAYGDMSYIGRWWIIVNISMSLIGCGIIEVLYGILVRLDNRKQDRGREHTPVRVPRNYERTIYDQTREEVH